MSSAARKQKDSQHPPWSHILEGGEPHF